MCACACACACACVCVCVHITGWGGVAAAARPATWPRRHVLCVCVEGVGCCQVAKQSGRVANVLSLLMMARPGCPKRLPSGCAAGWLEALAGWLANRRSPSRPRLCAHRHSPSRPRLCAHRRRRARWTPSASASTAAARAATQRWHAWPSGGESGPREGLPRVAWLSAVWGSLRSLRATAACLVPVSAAAWLPAPPVPSYGALLPFCPPDAAAC